MLPTSDLMALDASRGKFATLQPPPAEDAARQFEALLIERLLRAAREAGKPGSEQESDAGAESYREFADQHIAQALADSGAFGLARLIVAELKK